MTAPALDLTFPPGTLADLISAELGDLAASAVHERGGDEAPSWRVFFATAAARDAAAAALARRFDTDPLTITAVEVPDEDWAARTQAGLRHVRVGRVTVAPPWDVPEHSADEALVLIRPSMGFGTGHHATTRLCLRLLQTLDCRGCRVLDVGTGSGVLAIAAARLGASAVAGIDHDPDAIASANESLELNEARWSAEALPAYTRPRFVHGELRNLDEIADIVLANLTGAVLAAAAPQLASCAAPGGRLVLSGLQEHEIEVVTRAFEALSWQVRETLVEDGWVAALLSRV